MKIRRLEIERFRGIRSLIWQPASDIICLVGPGDSTKSTILDAIEFVLSPKWNIPFDDTDFHNADTSLPIEIKATIGELPENLIKDTKFGLELQGWSLEGFLHDEPEEADERVLTIRLRVDSSLEPSWDIISDRNPEGRHISARDRELFCTARLGAALDKHLSWGRGSILTRLTGEVKEAPALFASVVREARKGLDKDSLPSLSKIVATAQTQANSMGVRHTVGYEARLDLQVQHIGLGCLALHDGDVPLRNCGFGSRRLIAIALQQQSSQKGGITLIDEVEHGLEPHRIRHLVKNLKESALPVGDKGLHKPKVNSQVVMTTHSPTPIISLSAENIHITRSKDGITSVLPVPPTLQNIVRKVPDAFLAKKILVCEGKTELGLCWALDNYWTALGEESFAYLGVVPIPGGGSESPQTAKQLASLGYDVCLLADSDTELSPSESQLRQAGVAVIQWAGNCSIEVRIFQDLPINGVNELLKWIIEERGLDSVRQSIQSKTSPSLTLTDDYANWLNTDDVINLRGAIGKSANSNSWFKRPDLGEEMGNIMCKHLNQCIGTDTEQKIKSLKAWVFNGNNPSSSS